MRLRWRLKSRKNRYWYRRPPKHFRLLRKPSQSKGRILILQAPTSLKKWMEISNDFRSLKCSPVPTGGAIEHEDAKKGYCHLLNDVWMHAKNARILSFFAKDMKTLEEARKDLSQVHSRILDTSHEVMCSVGNTVALKMEVNSPPALKITSLGEAEITITQLLSDRNRYSLYFRPMPHPEKLGVGEEEYDVFYYARVVDNNNQDTEGGFSAPLDITWPLMHQQDATTSKAHASGPQKIIVSRPQAGSDIYIGGRRDHIDKSSKTLAVKRPPRKRLMMKDDTSSEED